MPAGSRPAPFDRAPWSNSAPRPSPRTRTTSAPSPRSASTRHGSDAEEPQRALLPLRGLPVGVKDIFDTAELPTAYGSAIYAGHRPKTDAAMVMLIQRAGGLVLGKTVTTEFASLEPAATRNPRNRAHTPGGSSSGSAAAVAAGMLPLALGSQTGGSVIRPAAFCGVAGFKPSYRLLPTVGMKCFSWSLDTVGLFGASVRRYCIRRRRDERSRSAGRWTTAGGGGRRSRAHTVMA